jgi:D-aminopeptidase
MRKPLNHLLLALITVAGTWAAGTSRLSGQSRPRARDVGVEIGRLPTGSWNAITDVAGVRVGHETVWIGDSIRTGVTAIVPRGGNLYDDPVRAAIVVGNGFGKLVGLSQVNELGEIETPILLTGTLSVFRAADALIDTLLANPENVGVRSINPVVGETNDGYLSDIRARPIRPPHVRAALRKAAVGPVQEGSVGAGTGTRALGWKGGIGTSSRMLETERGPLTVGVLVQTNFGGSLRIDGVPVGDSLRARGLSGQGSTDARGGPDGSVMIVVATDAPLAHRELERIGLRTFLGIARTGSYMSHGSGDYAIVFSTSRESASVDPRLLSSLFEATVEATEEAVINSLFGATTVTGHRGHRWEALPLAPTLELLLKARAATDPEASPRR